MSPKSAARVEAKEAVGLEEGEAEPAEVGVEEGEEGPEDRVGLWVRSVVVRPAGKPGS